MEAATDSKNHATCKICPKTFSLSNMGENALTSYAKSKRHTEKVNQINSEINNMKKYFMKPIDSSTSFLNNSKLSSLLSDQLIEASCSTSKEKLFIDLLVIKLNSYKRKKNFKFILRNIFLEIKIIYNTKFVIYFNWFIRFQKIQ